MHLSATIFKRWESLKIVRPRPAIHAIPIEKSRVWHVEYAEKTIAYNIPKLNQAPAKNAGPKLNCILMVGVGGA